MWSLYIHGWHDEWKKKCIWSIVEFIQLLVIFFPQQIYAKYKAAMKELSNLFYTEFWLSSWRRFWSSVHHMHIFSENRCQWTLLKVETLSHLQNTLHNADNCQFIQFAKGPWTPHMVNTSKIINLATEAWNTLNF